LARDSGRRSVGVPEKLWQGTFRLVGGGVRRLEMNRNTLASALIGSGGQTARTRRKVLFDRQPVLREGIGKKSSVVGADDGVV
jgi:hypothetical protein